MTLSSSGAAALTLAAAVSVTVLPAARAAETDTPRFNRDIRPILADNCLACHGPDNSARKAGLRLDTREGLFDRTPKRAPAFVPGNLNASAAWQRILSQDPDEVMPPPESHKTLTAEQREMLRRWIAAGAPWEGHWAFVRPERPPVPLVTAPPDFPIRNPIDAFVLARLQARGLSPSPPADRRTLARRLALDLTGLPPAPEAVEEFVGDPSPDAARKYVRRLLNSSAWGEHRARYWLDAARYADTHGLHFDNYREIWPYRDWVIKAFNRNMPFDQFTVEQLAGDLLDDATIDQLIATGFHRCTVTTNEGGTIEEENLALYANDRVTTTSWVWLGLTANCAACHDHKFDPISTKDFYSMAAFFRNTTQGGFDGNARDSKPSIVVPQTAADSTRWAALPREITAAQAAIDARKLAARPAFTNWAAGLRPWELDRDIASTQLVVHLPLNDERTPVAAAFAGNIVRLGTTAPLGWAAGGPIGSAPVITNRATLEVGDTADFERNQPFSFGAWVRINKPGTASILARMDEANDHRGWDLFEADRRLAVHLVNKWPATAIKVSTREEVLKDKTWHHVFVTYDGSSKGSGVRFYIDGASMPVNVDNNTLTNSMRTTATLRVGQRSTEHVFAGGQVQDVRIYARQLNAPEITGLYRAVPARHVLGLPAAERTTNQVESLYAYWLDTRDDAWQQRKRDHSALVAEQRAIRERSPVTLVQAEKTNSPATAHILFRGQYDKPKDKVSADTFAALPPMPAGAPRNRLGLARWLVSRDNPLTARVTVNRFWQEIFGLGLVRTAEDFGATGDTPTHPELLDWLAVEFQESGWDVKHLFELIASSSTYQQSAVTTPRKLELDPQNRLLSRGPRYRMDAEVLRDAALASSGLLVEKIGGPSVKPYQPPGVWEAVAMPESNTKKYQRDTGAGSYRRSLYTFWKRAAPPASMDLFNAPSRESCTVRRERTNTPLQALATLNDPQFLEAARNLARLALLAVRRDDEIPDYMARRLLSRPFTPEESAVVQQSLAAMQRHFEQHPDAATELVPGVDPAATPGLTPARLAAATMLANQLMNLDEALSK